MLGDISPQTVKITSSVVTYPGRDHVNVLNVKRFNGRSYSAVDLSLLTRAVLVFPKTSPVIAYDTLVAPAGTITWAGSDITIDLSDFSMPASVQSSYLIVYDAEHPGGQVLVDDNDSAVEFDFRNVSVEGVIQPPTIGPVTSVDGLTGAVILSSIYAPLSHVGTGGAAHANAVASGAAGFMTGSDKTKLDGVATGANNYVHPNHTGDVTSTGDGAQTIAANAVTNTKAADMAVNTLKGRITAGTGDPEDLTAAQVRTIINVADGANNYVHPNHTGDVTSTGDGAQTIAANAVTNIKLADMATQTIKGRTTAATGDPEDLTAAQVRTIINVADGATANQADAFLLARANHTGSQAISTVTGLQTALDGKTGLPVVQTFIGAKTLALTDINTYNVSQDATAQTVTIPAQATVTWTADAEIHIEQGAAGAVTVTGATGVSVNGVSAGSFTLAAQKSVVTLKRIGSDSWTLIGGLANSLVSGPASSGAGNIALYDGTTGKVIKDGGVVTAAGLALLDDASAAAQATTLGLGTGNSPTFTALALTNGQIVFPATQVPSANANTLDDYEEGTWTPTLTFATPGDLSVTYAVRSGTYIKIGSTVTIGMAVTTTAFTHSTASGNMNITGNPFIASSSTASRGSGSLDWGGITKAGYGTVIASCTESSTIISFVASGSGLTPSQVISADVPSGGSPRLISTFQFMT